MPFSDFFFAPFLSPASFYSGSSNGRGSSHGCAYCFIGWDVWLQYDASDVRSDDATVEVLTTDGQHIAVLFDLSHLR